MTYFGIIAEFRTNGGRTGAPFPGSGILRQHHTGAAQQALARGGIPVVVLDPLK